MLFFCCCLGTNLIPVTACYLQSKQVFRCVGRWRHGADGPLGVPELSLSSRAGVRLSVVSFVRTQDRSALRVGGGSGGGSGALSSTVLIPTWEARAVLFDALRMLWRVAKHRCLQSGHGMLMCVASVACVGSLRRASLYTAIVSRRSSWQARHFAPKTVCAPTTPPPPLHSRRCSKTLSPPAFACHCSSSESTTGKYPAAVHGANKET